VDERTFSTTVVQVLPSPIDREVAAKLARPFTLEHVDVRRGGCSVKPENI